MGARVYANWMFTSAGKLGESVAFDLTGDKDGKEVKAIIDKLIAQHQVMIFSKSYCPHCHRAKKIFDDINQKYTLVELNKLPEMGLIQDELNRMTGARTVPRVFVNGKCIGGGEETAQFLESGELQKMLAS